jgi:glycosyltransferase involved in cell wall biosynthesis
MKILIIHNKYLQKGGEDNVIESEYELLMQRGFDVRLHCVSNPVGVLKSIFYYTLSPFNFIQYYDVLKVLKRVKPDIVHLHNWHYKASPSIIWAVKRLQIPIVHTLHNYRLICPSATLFYEGKLYEKSIASTFPWDAVFKGVYNNSIALTFWLAFTIWFNRLIGTWKKVDRYIVLTDFAKSLIERSSCRLKLNQIAVKPNFVVSNDNELTKRKNHFLFVGRLTDDKGIKLLLTSFVNSAFQIRIIGDGPLKSLVEETSSCNSNIVYLGYQSKKIIEKELSTCNALIFPSIWYEGMPLTIIESLSRGTPVIASKLGAMEEMIIHGYNGILYRHDSEQSLLGAITFWEKMEPEEKEEFRNNARSAYNRLYNPEKNVSDLISIYRSVIDEKEGVN